MEREKVKFYPYKKGGGGGGRKSFRNAEGGTQKVLRKC